MKYNAIKLNNPYLLRVGDIVIIRNDDFKQEILVRITIIKHMSSTYILPFIKFDLIEVSQDDFDDEEDDNSLITDEHLSNGLFLFSSDEIYVCNTTKEKLLAREL
jgi:hypothetical protein